MNMRWMFAVLVPFLLMGCPQSHRNRFSPDEIAGLFKDGRYEECVRETRSFLSQNQKRLMKKGQFPALFDMYTTASECSFRNGDAGSASDFLNEMLNAIEIHLSLDQRAETEMKIGHFRRSAGQYTKAIAAYEHVARAYAEHEPDRYAAPARENALALMIQRIAEITGKVQLEDLQAHQGVLIRVFNGFEESETITDADGAFRVPLFSSTPGTIFVVSATAIGFYPLLMDMIFDGRMNIQLGTFKLKSAPENMAVLAGMIYTPVSEQNVERAHGIHGFSSREIAVYPIIDPKKNDTGKGVQPITLKSDDRGRFIKVLPPGHYRIQKKPTPIHFFLSKKDVRLEYIQNTKPISTADQTASFPIQHIEPGSNSDMKRTPVRPEQFPEKPPGNPRKGCCR